MRLHDYLEFYARERPNVDFVVMGDRSLTYAEADARANQLANAFAAAGLQKGDRFAYVSKNSLEYPIVYFGASKAGVVPVPLNYRLAPPEWAYIVNDSQSKMLLSSAEYQEGIDAIRGELETVGKYISIEGDGELGWDDFNVWVDGQPDSRPAREVDHGDDLYQMYTSGTTGRPKGTVLAHEAVTANMTQARQIINMEPGDRDLIIAPLYHAAAVLTAFAVVGMGATLVIHEDFIPPDVVRALSQGNIAYTTMVPAMIQACLVYVPDVAERNYDTLKGITYGVSPIAEQTLRRAMEVFKCDFTQVYGMTELTACVTSMSPSDHSRALESKSELLLPAGRPVVGAEIRIVDEDDNDLPNGTIGEIIVNGPQVMKGYWNLQDESDEALKGGWMHTGDAGVVDDEGYLYVQDRVKDMIVSGGENVYPRVVEDVLFTHPAVADSAVIGVPDAQWGEIVKALVVLREVASATNEEIMEFCLGKLGGFERPRSVDFVTELPRNATGKVLKRVLREPYWEGHGRRVAGV
jgi:acyl-CoA synthetase (AMP-forming)/AMP-acid ligase II